jgi:hypothetical protein
MAGECTTISAPGTTLPFAKISEPGTYICNRSGHLLRVSDDRVTMGRSPLLDIVGHEPPSLTKIANNPFIALTKARMLAADMDISVNF